MAALCRLFEAPHVDGARFAPELLRNAPLRRITMLVRHTDALGAVRTIERVERGYRVDFAHGLVPMRAELDAAGRFTAIWFDGIEYRDVEIASLMKAISGLPGQHGVLVTTDGVKTIGLGEDQPLMVASAFKLAVLAALVDAINEGRLRWGDVVELRQSWKSLPSGSLQTWPAHTPITIAALAIAMISVSDNTATDALVDLVGRDRIEREAPTLRPLLTTREAFTLRLPDEAGLLARFRDGDEEERRRVIDDLGRAEAPEVRNVDGVRPTREAEWSLSAIDLCRLMTKVEGLALFSVNPGFARRSDWTRISYKGGSDAGVLNATTWVEHEGHHHCVVWTWNGSPDVVHFGIFADLYRGLLAAVRRQ